MSDFAANPAGLDRRGMRAMGSVRNLLMLFAPKFDGFGCDVGRAFVARSNCGRVHGLCTGPCEVRAHVVEKLGDIGGRFWYLAKEEEAWLSTPASIDELKRFEQELGSGAFGRIVTADRRIGRGFVRGGLTRPDGIGRRAARDPTVSAQRYVNGLYAFLTMVLDETETDVVFCYAVAGAPAVALAEICRARDIPFCRLTHTRMGDGHIVDNDAKGRQALAARRFERARDGCEPFTSAILEKARGQLEAFRARPVQPGYSRRTDSSRRHGGVMSRTIKAALSIPIVDRQGLLRPRWSGTEVARRLFKIRISLRRKFASRTYFSSADGLPEDFVYYPLHVDPEASTMVLSPWCTDQISVIEALAKSAPAHMRVVVKEHSPMLGRRSRGFYRRIARMPRVTLLGPEHSSFDLIEKASLTAVITGTAAWEAVLLGKPALIIGDSPFLSIGAGLVHERNLSRLPQAIEAALSSPLPSDETLILYIAATLEESFEMPSSLLWGDYDTHTADCRQTASAAIAKAILRTMNEHARDAEPCRDQNREIPLQCLSSEPSKSCPPNQANQPGS